MKGYGGFKDCDDYVQYSSFLNFIKFRLQF